MSEPLVQAERHGSVACLTLNRPDRGNCIDMDMAEALHAAVTLAGQDRVVRCVVLTGAGKLFCAGGDVHAFAAAGTEAGLYLRGLAKRLHQSIVALATMDKPLVVAVNGPAAGAGFSLALLGDIVIAGSSAHFTAAYSGIGLTPDGGLSWLLPRLVGLRAAQAILIENRRIQADEATTMGLVTRTCDPGLLASDSMEAAQRLARGPVHALAGARALLLQGATASLASHLDSEARRIEQAGNHGEAREGIAAFLARRAPSFDG